MKNQHIIGYALALASLSNPSHANFFNGVAAGDVTQDSAVVWAHNNKKATDGSISVLFKYSTDPSFGTLAGSQTVVQNSYIEPAKLKLTGLQPGTTYYYRAEDSLGKFLDGRFKTLPASDSQPRLKFGVLDEVRRATTVFPNNLAGLNNDFNIANGSFLPSGRYSLLAYVSSFNLPGIQVSLHEALKNTDGVGNKLTGLRRSAAIFQTLNPLDIGLPPYTAGGAAPNTYPTDFDQTGNYINETRRFKEGVLAFQ
jgi:alkaline phosphatase D